MTPFEICKTIQRAILRTTSEVMAYQSWSGEFALKQIRDLETSIKRSSWYVPVDPNDLTIEELRELGFSQWNDEQLMLIPLWLFPFLPPVFEGGCITGERGNLIHSSLDNDNRAGFTAFGVYKEPITCLGQKKIPNVHSLR